MIPSVIDAVTKSYKFVKNQSKYFLHSDYLWILGYEVVDELDELFIKNDFDNMQLFGISVIIDRVNRNRIDLFWNLSQELRDRHII